MRNRPAITMEVDAEVTNGSSASTAQSADKIGLGAEQEEDDHFVNVADLQLGMRCMVSVCHCSRQRRHYGRSSPDLRTRPDEATPVTNTVRRRAPIGKRCDEHNTAEQPRRRRAWAIAADRVEA